MCQINILLPIGMVWAYIFLWKRYICETEVFLSIVIYYFKRGKQNSLIWGPYNVEATFVQSTRMH